MKKNKCTMYDISAGEFSVCIREVHAKLQRLTQYFVN